MQLASVDTFSYLHNSVYTSPKTREIAAKMADRSEVTAACAILMAVVLRKRQRRRRNRRIWTRERILNREEQGAFHQLILKSLSDARSYQNFVRMDAATFEELICVVAPKITYQDTVMRQAISPAERQ